MPRKPTTDEPKKDPLDKIRMEFWMQAWLAYCSRPTVDVTKAKLWANQALLDFDAVFRGIVPPNDPVFQLPTVDDLMQGVVQGVVKVPGIQKANVPARPALPTSPNPTLVNAAFPTSEEVVMEVASHR